MTIRQVQSDVFFDAVLTALAARPEVTSVELAADGRWRAGAAEAWHTVTPEAVAAADRAALAAKAERSAAPAAATSPVKPPPPPPPPQAAAQNVVDLLDSDSDDGGAAAPAAAAAPVGAVVHEEVCSGQGARGAAAVHGRPVNDVAAQQARKRLKVVHGARAVGGADR